MKQTPGLPDLTTRTHVLFLGFSFLIDFKKRRLFNCLCVCRAGVRVRFRVGVLCDYNKVNIRILGLIYFFIEREYFHSDKILK